MKISGKFEDNGTEAKLSNCIKSIQYSLNKAGTEVTGILVRTARPYVPKRYGFLRQALQYTESSGTLVRYNVTYRAFDYYKHTFNYAWIQENWQYPHYTTPGTGSHYVERGLQAGKQQAIQAIESAVNRGLMNNGR